MSTDAEYQAANMLAPFKNASGFAAQMQIPFGTTTRVFDLLKFFGPTGGADPGHFFTMQPDGAKAYVALGFASGSINENATGFPVNINDQVCYPVADGAEKHFRLAGSTRTKLGLTGTASGLHGTPTQAIFSYLHIKSATTGGGSGMLNIFRSSIAPGQDVGFEFRGP